MIVKCSTCNKEFNKPKHQIKRSKNHFCSKDCQYESYRTTPEEKKATRQKYQKEYRQRPEVKEKKKKYQEQYHKDNKKLLNKKQREWYSKNKEDQQRKSRERYSGNTEEMREKSRARQQKWKKDNPDGYFLSKLRYKLNPLTKFKTKANREKKRAKKYNCIIGDEKKILEKYIEISLIDSTACYYCGEDCGSAIAGYQKDITIDHKTPLSRGGNHDVDNMVICCRQCNSSKERKTEEEYKEYLKTIERLSDKI